MTLGFFSGHPLLVVQQDLCRQGWYYFHRILLCKLAVIRTWYSMARGNISCQHFLRKNFVGVFVRIVARRRDWGMVLEIYQKYFHAAWTISAILFRHLLKICAKKLLEISALIAYQSSGQTDRKKTGFFIVFLKQIKPCSCSSWSS